MPFDNHRNRKDKVSYIAKDARWVIGKNIHPTNKMIRNLCLFERKFETFFIWKIKKNSSKLVE